MLCAFRCVVVFRSFSLLFLTHIHIICMIMTVTAIVSVIIEAQSFEAQDMGAHVESRRGILGMGCREHVAVRFVCSNTRCQTLNTRCILLRPVPSIPYPIPLQQLNMQQYHLQSHPDPRLLEP